MKAELIVGCIKDENGLVYESYGFKIADKIFEDISVDKDFVLKFIEFLNSEPEPQECIEIVLEDYLS